MRKISGGFSVPIFNILCNDQALINEISSVLLSEHFPESLHNDILSAVGLSINKTTLSSKEPRDPKFAKTILSAYGYRCAICNLEIHVAGQSIGLEAAHVKWHSAGGSSTVDNGLCLCPIHHKGLDLGIIGLDKDLMIHISQDLRSDMHEDHMFGRHNKLPLLKPLSGQSSISVSNIEWHTKQVFRSPARP
jgi:putative restriction endonuclease